MNRRSFLVHLGAATALPLLSSRLHAEDKTAAPNRSLHKVLSCNIRVALPEDEARGNGWSTRRDVCIEVIRNQKPDVFCLQEVLREQMHDLQRAFPNFGSFGFEGPEMDARMVGYHGIAKNPIFYSQERYDLVTAGGYWLSETPHIAGSLSWDSARARHVNWVRLRDRKSGRQFRVLSTHLDHVSQRAREEQIKMVLADAAVYAPEFPQILAGDFNASAANNVYNLVIEAGWTDSRMASPEPRDNGNTTHGFLGEKAPKSEAAKKRGPIDFIFTRGPVSTLEWKIVRDSRDEIYPSDHYFIAAQLAIDA